MEQDLAGAVEVPETGTEPASKGPDTDTIVRETQQDGEFQGDY